MTRPLENITVAIAEHRFTKELTTLFERSGANVYACPVLEEKPLEDPTALQQFIHEVVSDRFNVMIFLTGVGAKFLVAEAESIGLKSQFLQALNKLTVVVRGPKPVAALRQFGVRVDVLPETPTSEGVIEALRGRNLKGARVAVQLYGSPNPELVSGLETLGAVVVPVQVYSYGIAADPASVEVLITRLLNHEIQVVAFTSAPQVRMLFALAEQLGLKTKLDGCLRSGILIASIGDVTARALKEFSLVPDIVPKQSKMAALVQAVADYFERKAPSR